MRVVLVTGAGGALGSALSGRFHDRGHAVVQADLSPPAPVGAQGLPIACDVTEPADLADAVAATVEHFGGMDVLVNCAGITHRSPAATTDPDLLAHVMAVNWEGPMRLAQLSLPRLAERAGSIVNVSSMAAWMPVLGRAAYGASKAALTQFMEVLRHEAAAVGVNVLNVHPSFLDAIMPDTATSGDPRPRTQLGSPLAVGDMADRIVAAEAARRRWLFPDRRAHAASLLWRLAPGTYHRVMARRFATELPASSPGSGKATTDG